MARARTGRTTRTEGVVLRRRSMGEADRLVTLYTPYHGKVKAMAKGIRRPKSKMAGHLELFMRTDLLIAEGRTFDIITQAEMIEGYLPLRQSLDAMTYASHFVELLDGFTEENDENRRIYLLLASGLAWLAATNSLERTARYFELKLLDAAGYQVQVMNCTICGQELQPRAQFYSVMAGGVVCPDCAHNRNDVFRLSLNALKVLRFMERYPFQEVEGLNLSPGVLAEVERLLHATLRFYLERRLRSVDFLQRLRQESSAR